MKRVLLVLTFLLVLGGAVAFQAGVLAAQQPPPPPSPGPTPRDPLEEFVPHEKLGAESVVAFPVDI
jgi:hypothetical protein